MLVVYGLTFHSSEVRDSRMDVGVRVDRCNNFHLPTGFYCNNVYICNLAGSIMKQLKQETLRDRR